MTIRKERELLLQEASRLELLRGQIDRREFLTRSLMAGLGMAGVGAVAKGSIMPALAQDRPLTPTFYQWIQDLHPSIPKVNEKFPGINYQIAPVEGFGIERFVAEAKNKESTWDVYVGQTPFVEMSASACKWISRVLQLAVIGLIVFHETMTHVRWIGFVMVWIALAIFTADALRHYRSTR